MKASCGTQNYHLTLSSLQRDLLLLCFSFLDLFSLVCLLRASQFIAWHARLDALWFSRWRKITLKWTKLPSALTVGKYTLELPPKSGVYQTLLLCLQNLCFYCGRLVKGSLEGPNTFQAFGHLICRLCSGEQLIDERVAILCGLGPPFFLPRIRQGPKHLYKREQVHALRKRRSDGGNLQSKRLTSGASDLQASFARCSANNRHLGS